MSTPPAGFPSPMSHVIVLKELVYKSVSTGKEKEEKLFRFFFSSRVSERKAVEGVSSGGSRKAN